MLQALVVSLLSPLAVVGLHGVELLVDGHGLGHHPRHVPRVGGQQHRVTGLGQASKRLDIVLSHSETSGVSTLLCPKRLSDRLYKTDIKWIIFNKS